MCHRNEAHLVLRALFKNHVSQLSCAGAARSSSTSSNVIFQEKCLSRRICASCRVYGKVVKGIGRDGRAGHTGHAGLKGQEESVTGPAYVTWCLMAVVTDERRHRQHCQRRQHGRRPDFRCGRNKKDKKKRKDRTALPL